MKKTVFVAAGMTLLLSAGVALGKKQVLSNGSFECFDPNTNFACDWAQFGNVQVNTAFSLDGLYSELGSIRNGAFVGAFQDPVSVGSDTRVFLKCMAYIPASAPLINDDSAGIKLEFGPPEGIEVPPPVENLAFEPNRPNYAEDTWVSVSVSDTVPPDITVAEIVMISFDNDPNNGPVYCDSAFVEFGSAPGVNQLLNASFEDGTSAADGLDNWDEFAGAGSGARKNAFEVPADDGSNVLRMDGLTCGVIQDVAVTPGDTITVTAKFRSNGANSYASMLAQAGVKIQWSAGTVPGPNIDIRPNANPISGTTNTIFPGHAVDTWFPVTIDYTIPSGNAARLRATLITGFGPAPTDVYYDAFEFVLMNVFDGADSDGDDDEDMVDMANLQRVFTGAGGGLVYGGLVFDEDEDQDVDADDSDYALVRMTGPAN